MTLQLVVDMNLTPDWVEVFNRHGWPAVHWSTIGDHRAHDATIMSRALANQKVVFTHDLDFGTLLALTHANGPSVVQVRGTDVLPEDISAEVLGALTKYESELAAGALVVVDIKRSRVRVLPI